MANPLVAPILGFLGRLSFPRLFALTGALFLLNMIVPDILPFFDELMLGLGTLLLGSFKKRKEPVAPIEGEATRQP